MKLLLRRLPACFKSLVAIGMVQLLASCSTSPQLQKPSTLTLANIDATVQSAMAATCAKGLGVAVVHNGQVVLTKAYGVRNAANAPLSIDTVMYGASLTKSAFAFLVMQLVDEGRLDLDKSIAEYLLMPLPSYSSDADARAYAPCSHLLKDERWRNITPRILLTHSAGFARQGHASFSV